ncbi:MAG: type II secretion system GspH family protein [Defluviitaleaceae bacterium]|nr:type II secretion system GspH family protein [Defluviitaleaceae bacterium]
MNKGFTLLETVIALALWLILSAGIFMVWNYSTHRGTEMLERQSTFENARIAMDAMKMNFQLSRTIILRTGENDVLQSVTMNQLNPQGQWHDYRFTFNAGQQRLTFPDAGNEFASDISEIRIAYVNSSRMRIKITTDCEEPIVLEGSVCVRYKSVTVIGGSP